MCGLVGGTNPQWDYESAIESLRHRGPDSRRVVRLRDLTLGFARLSIIDVHPRANQPMTTQDESVWIVFNGEIYGYRALRKQLIKLGQTFRTQSDTEVVLNAYLQWGDDFIDRIDGMFAIAVYDLRQGRLQLFRDRVGIKPLYYYWDGRNFAFASELKAIEELCRSCHLEIDNTALFDFLTYRYIPTPKTLYRNVFKLPAANVLTFNIQSRCISRLSSYWEVPSPMQSSGAVSIEDASAEQKQLLASSVREQLHADVPVGLFLSGGIDSSALVATAAQQQSQVRTFTVGFDDPERSETDFARQVADRYRTDHHEGRFARGELDRLIPKLRNWYDEPFADTSAFPTWYLCRMASRSVKVAISGDGGDELFGGYDWYRRYHSLLNRFGWMQCRGTARWFEKQHACMQRRGPVRRFFSIAKKAVADKFALYVTALNGMTRGQKWKYESELGIDRDYDDYWHFRQHWRSDLPLLTRLQYLDFHTFLPDAILTKVDRVSMANSLEVRVPFLSRELIEFAFRLPEHVRCYGGQPKGLLKYAYRDALPATVLQRKKQGFSTPPQYIPSRHRLQEQILAQQDLVGV